MTIHKRKTARAVVKAGRPIDYPVLSRSGALGHHHAEGAIVDAVRMFVEEHERRGRPRIYKVRHLEKQTIGWTRSPGNAAVAGNHRAHRHASDAGIHFSPNPDSALIGRAFVDPGG